MDGVVCSKPFGVRGPSLRSTRDGSHYGITLSKLSGTKQPYEVEPRRVPTPGPLGPACPLSWEMLDVAPQKPLRADEPVTQNDELGLRGVTASNQTGAAGIETRVRLVWPGCLPRRLQLVFTRSSGRNSLFARCPIVLVQSRSDSFGFDVQSPVTGPGANPAERGPTSAAA